MKRTLLPLILLITILAISLVHFGFEPTGSIDTPIMLSRILDGSGYDEGIDVEIDSVGNIYVVGATDSLDFPVVDGFNMTNNGKIDCFIAKLRSSDGRIIHSTYFGGKEDDVPIDLQLDAHDNIYITGSTESEDFPNTFSSTTAALSTNIFITKIDGSTLEIDYSVVIGGSGIDVSNSIAIDSEENAYIVGSTSSSDFPLLSDQGAPFQGPVDGLIVKVNKTGIPSQYSYLSGSGTEDVLDILISNSQTAWVIGTTDSNYFLGRSFNPSSLDCFITSINTSTLSPLNISLFGGSGNDIPSNMGIDSNRFAYISGTTTSTDFPQADPSESSLKGIRNSFMVKYSLDSDALEVAKYLGGSSIDEAQSVAIDKNGSVYIAGFTESLDFPLEDPIVDEYQGGSYDAYITKLHPDEASFGFSTYIGGSKNDFINSLTLSESSVIVVTGFTTSSDFKPIVDEGMIDPVGVNSACFVLALTDLTDSDDDMLRDVVEHRIGTDPNLTDSDSDSFSDYWELTNRFNPLDSRIDIIESILYHSDTLVLVLVILLILSMVATQQKSIKKLAYRLHTIPYYWRGLFGTLLLTVSLVGFPLGVRYHITNNNTMLFFDFLFPFILRASDSQIVLMAPFSILGIMMPIIGALSILLIWYSVLSVRKRQKHSTFLFYLAIYAFIDFLVFFPTLSSDRGSIPLPFGFLFGLVFYHSCLPQPAKTPFENEDG